MELTVYAKVLDYGWSACTIEMKGAPAGEVTLTMLRKGKETPVNILSQHREGDVLRIECEPFSYKEDFCLCIGETTFDKADVAATVTEGVDDFAAKEENGVLYRLYSPKSAAARPLILFLHGGGEGGYDNVTQLLGTLGAIHIAQQYPDMYVMAPQAPQPKNFIPGDMNQPFAGMKQHPEYGWTRTYLANVCDIIRAMIARGEVNPARVYVVGMSMGGGGTLRALSVGSDLFAAGAPICPTMIPETYNILKNLVHMKIWVSAAYVDHTIYRHKYIVEGVEALRAAGNTNARLTLYSPEDLAKYGMATQPGIEHKERFSQNHNCWINTLHDENGIMTWLTTQVKG